MYLSTRVYTSVGSCASLKKQQKEFEKGDATEVCGMCIKYLKGDKILFLYQSTANDDSVLTNDVSEEVKFIIIILQQCLVNFVKISDVPEKRTPKSKGASTPQKSTPSKYT